MIANQKPLCNTGNSNCRITTTAKKPRLTIDKVSVLAQCSLAGSCVHKAMSVQLQRLGCKVLCIQFAQTHRPVDVRAQQYLVISTILATWIKRGRQ